MVDSPRAERRSDRSLGSGHTLPLAEAAPARHPPWTLTLFSADWFLCVASRMVMNCRYWGLVQRPTPGGGKQGEQVSGREQETGKQKASEEK